VTRAWLVALFLAVSARALAQVPRDSIEVGTVAGAAAVREESDWGEARYAIAGVDARFVRRRDAGHFGVAAASMIGARYGLDEPSFEQFGWVADRFTGTYLGAVMGADVRWFGLEVTFGGVVQTIDASSRSATTSLGASCTMRGLDPAYVAITGRLGSTDGWLLDRTGMSVGLLHDRQGFRIAASFVAGLSRIPPLYSRRDDGPPANLTPRGRNFDISEADLLARLEVGAHLREHDFGFTLTVGSQLPIARVYYRRNFGTAPQIVPTRAARPGRSFGGRYAAVVPR